MLDAFLNIDKPAGLSSAGTLNRIKRLLPRGTKLGHAGTLDPFATGVLVALVGRATRRCEQVMDQPKTYLATIKLGATTPTDDPQSEESPVAGAVPPTAEALDESLQRFVGTIEQRPPAYSAMRLAGRRAYDLARQGQVVQLPPRPVRIDRVTLLSYNWPLARVEIACGRGVYIRAIARDLGERLQTGGHLVQLARTRVGAFRVDDAVSLERLLEEGVQPHLLPAATAVKSHGPDAE